MNKIYTAYTIPVYFYVGPKSLFCHSCGKVVVGCKTKLDKPDEDGNGEICFWGRHVFMGYLNMPDKTEEALDHEGWLHSGDLGKHDKKDFLFITGRIKGRPFGITYRFIGASIKSH